VFKIIEFF